MFLQPYPVLLSVALTSSSIYLCSYNLVLYSFSCYSTTSSSLPCVATTSSCITLCCYIIIQYSLWCNNLILYYFMLLQPHPLLLSVATKSSSIPSVSTTSSSIPYVSTTSSSIPYVGTALKKVVST